MRIDDDPEFRAWQVARDAAHAGTGEQSISNSQFFAELEHAVRNSPPGDTNAELIKAYTRGGDGAYAEKVAEIVSRDQSTSIRIPDDNNESGIL
jgi:hypothetical protein